ncbi:MAG: fimbrillin family protein [Prevotella sp.]|nr:fimbrillin family protein [Prevotella sp.]
MKKNYWILAAAAVVLAACSNDDTIAVNQGIEEANTINFSNTIVEGQTRAVGITSGSLLSFYVTANRGTDIYFGEAPVQFAKDDSTDPVSYRSETKYYWPSEGKLDFYAFAPATGTTITRTDSTHFSVTPATTPATQEDFVYGVVRQQDKTTGGQGVALNFRHAMSNVIIQLKNTASDLDVTVGNVAIGYILPTGAFAPIFKTAAGSEVGFSTNGTNISNVTSDNGYYIAPGAWAASGDRTSYTQAATTTSYTSATATTALPADMILVPQTLVKAEGYSAATAGSGFNGACITVQVKIQDKQGHYLAGTASNFVTAMWPLAATQWLPGHKYTYTLDLAGGGYFPTNQENTDENLDPILKNAEIFFLTPTVDEWIAAPGIDVDNND